MVLFVRRHPLMLVLLLALLPRLAAAAAVQWHLNQTGERFLIAGDADGYWRLADQIARGQEYAVYDPPRRVLRMPGFPLLLAPVRYFFGDALFVARIWTAVLGSAACGAVYLLARALTDTTVALLAGSFAALWPTLVGFSAVLLSETPFALFLTLSLAATAELVRRTRLEAHSSRFVDSPTWWAAVTGVAIAVAVYVRPTWLPAAIVIPPAYWLYSGCTWRSALRGAVIVATVLLMLTPWTIRNFRVTGHVVPTTLWVGPSLYDGLNPTATGASDMRFFDEDDLMSRMTEYDMDREYRRRAWNYAAENPGRAVQLAFIKLWRYGRPDPSAEQFSSAAARLLVGGAYMCVLGLALVGAVRRYNEFWLLCLCGGPLLAFGIVHMFFVGSLRYRLPAEYPLCVLAAVGCLTLWNSYRERRGSSLPSPRTTAGGQSIAINPANRRSF